MIDFKNQITEILGTLTTYKIFFPCDVASWPTLGHSSKNCDYRDYSPLPDTRFFFLAFLSFSALKRENTIIIRKKPINMELQLQQEAKGWQILWTTVFFICFKIMVATFPAWRLAWNLTIRDPVQAGQFCEENNRLMYPMISLAESIFLLLWYVAYAWVRLHSWKPIWAQLSGGDKRVQARCAPESRRAQQTPALTPIMDPGGKWGLQHEGSSQEQLVRRQLRGAEEAHAPPSPLAPT